MQLNHLSLTDFRNYARLDIDVPGGLVLVVGGNAQGKTSLLEAIYYLATVTSFQATPDRLLINFVEKKEPLAIGRIVAEFSHTGDESGLVTRSGRIRRLEIRLIEEWNSVNGAARFRKEVLLDGVKYKLGESVGVFTAVLFTPQMLRVVEGPPEERRRYLDLLLGQVLPNYANNLADYNRTISQRNALLKQIKEFDSDPTQLDYWDERIAEYGARIIHARIQAILEIEILAGRAQRELTQSNEVLRLFYQPAFDPYSAPPGQFQLPMDTAVDRSEFSIEQIRRGFIEKIISLRAQELLRGVTTIGPHRDELRFLINGVDVGTFGSRGQERTTVLGLKLAEMVWIKEKTGQQPVLLFDEVLAELDPVRRNDLLNRLLNIEQAILTTTDLDLFPAEFIQQAVIWRIEAGQVFT